MRTSHALWLVLAACGADPKAGGGERAEPAVASEVCDNLTDDDLDGLVDCLDADCDGSCPEACGDGRDNDGDGQADCDDPDCFSDECPESCDDGLDNDADGRADCDDLDCSDTCLEVCTDGRDNDADGLIDCDDDECSAVCDADGDGFDSVDLGGDDCDDARSDVNPGQDEICDGTESLDNDCDGLLDEDDPSLDLATLGSWGRDDDGDGFGTDEELVACQAPGGFGPAETDCDDTRGDINPAMPEICNPEEPLDDDCDGLIDDDDDDVMEASYLDWYPDDDGDGFGTDDGRIVESCTRPEGTSATNDDCDDADPTVGRPSLWLADRDGDGFGSGEPIDPTPSCESPEPDHAPDWVGEDCDDEDELTYPGAPELCSDGVDQDCSGDDERCAKMYAADGRGVVGGGLYEIDLRAGTVEPVARLDYAITGLSFSPDGELYAVSSLGYGYFGAGNQVYHVDLDTYELRSVAELVLPSWSGFSWSTGDGNLYGWTQHESALHLIDLTSGTSRRLLRGEGSYGHCMAFDASGRLYRLIANSLLEVDLDLGTETALGVVAGLPVGQDGQGCAFLDGLLYVAPFDSWGGAPRELYAIDIATLSATPTGIVLSEDTDALGAFEP